MDPLGVRLTTEAIYTGSKSNLCQQRDGLENVKPEPLGDIMLLLFIVDIMLLLI